MTSVMRWFALFGGCSLFFVLMGLFWLFRGAITRKREQLASRLLGDQPAAIRIKARRLREHEVSKLHLLLERAAVGVNPHGFLAICAGAVLFVTLAGAVSLNVAAGFVLGIATVAAVYFVVRLRADKRIQAVARQFPSALEMVTLSLRAGRGLEESIHVAAEQVEAPLSVELRRCYEECSMGKPVEEALTQLGTRWEPVRGIGLFVEAVSVLKQTGGNLVEVLDSIRKHVRSREAYESKHRAMTSEGRLSGRILMALPLVALVIQVFMAPEELRDMIASSGGRTVMLVACVLWGLGVLWVTRLTRPARY
jgi:tight adherence protein B